MLGIVYGECPHLFATEPKSCLDFILYSLLGCLFTAYAFVLMSKKESYNEVTLLITYYTLLKCKFQLFGLLAQEVERHTVVG